MMRTVVFAFLASMATLGSAQADWEYTRWGMTPEQVLAASNGQMKACDERACRGQQAESQVARLYGNVRQDGFAFTAFASFDRRSGRLAAINLRLEGGAKSDDLIQVLRKRYGEPATKSVTMLMEYWTWRDKGDHVSVVIIDDNVTLGYQAATAGAQRAP